MARVGIAVVLIVALGCGSREEYSAASLARTLKDKDPNMRYWAAQSLGRLGPAAQSAVPDLLDGLRDKDAMVRMGTAYALGAIGTTSPEVTAALKNALKDGDPQVRQAAAFAWKQLQKQKK